MFHPESVPSRAIRLARWLSAALLAVFFALPPAAAADNPSGLPLPRFVTTRSSPINVRVGPGTKYGIAWVYVKAGVPVEIIQEFDTWRKIRDVDGSTGWLHQNLLAGRRSAIIAPGGEGGDRIGLRARASDAADVVAWLTPGYPVELKSCDGTWCRATALANGDGGNRAYDGYLPQELLWGAYRGEVFD